MAGREGERREGKKSKKGEEKAKRKGREGEEKEGEGWGMELVFSPFC